MNPNDTVTPPQISLPDTGKKEMDDIRKPSFWIGHCFILAATILGVYLASSQGFKQAIAYGDIQSDKNNFFLRKSLQSEIRDNLPLVRDYMKRLETGGLPARQAPFSLDTFVWENMKFSSATLETPPEILRECRNFYRGVADIQQKISSSTYGVKFGSDKLQELVNHMEKNVLPMFDADLEKLRKSLAARKVRVE